MFQHAAPTTPAEPPPARPRTAWFKPGWWHAPLVVLGLVVVTIATYGRVCGHEFTWWDDPDTLHHNPRYNPPSGEAIRETWVKPIDGLYAPVTYSYWGALAFLAEMPDTTETGIHLDARVFHVGSMVLHVLSVLVVFAILKGLSQNVVAAGGGALLFALHPVQVESVAWASGAKDLLAGLLSLLAVYQYLRFARFRRAGETSRRKVWTAYGSGAVLMVFAMLSKPSAMVVPVVVAVLDAWVIGRPWRQVAWSAGGWAVVIVPLAVIARIVQVSDHLPPVALWHRPLVAADAVAFYLWKMVWPVGMTPDYARRPDVVLGMGGGAWKWLIWVVPVGLGVWLWRGRASRPWALAGLAVFVAAVGPVLGLVPFMFQYTSTVADHYLYVAMFGPALVLTWALVRYRNRMVLAGCGVALAALALRSHDQLRHWRDDLTLWTHGMAVCPDSFVARANVAADLGRAGFALHFKAIDLRAEGKVEEAAKLKAEARRNYELAVELLEEAIRIRPTYLVARHNAHLNYLRLGQYAKAAEHLEVLLAAGAGRGEDVQKRLQPYHQSLGGLWLRAGQYARAIPHFEKVLARDPEQAEARAGLAEARAKLATEARMGLEGVER